MELNSSVSVFPKTESNTMSDEEDLNIFEEVVRVTTLTPLGETPIAGPSEKPSPETATDDGRLHIGVTDVSEYFPSRRPSFQFPGLIVQGIDEVNGIKKPMPDVNAYQHKKTLAQGMMDLALLSANANQLRYVLQSPGHPYYYPSLIFISISIIFQVAVGVGLILNSRYDIKDENDIYRANTINNFTVIGIFIVTVVNVFISAFGVVDSTLQSI